MPVSMAATKHATLTATSLAATRGHRAALVLGLLGSQLPSPSTLTIAPAASVEEYVMLKVSLRSRTHKVRWTGTLNCFRLRMND